MNLLATRQDYNKARSLILKKLTRSTATRSTFGNLHLYGISRIATELALAQLLQDGIVEQLLVLPRQQERAGSKPTLFALTADLDAGLVELPEGVMRIKDALVLVER